MSLTKMILAFIGLTLANDEALTQNDNRVCSGKICLCYEDSTC